jgi:iron complex transport system ATP-binding protein
MNTDRTKQPFQVLFLSAFIGVHLWLTRMADLLRASSVSFAFGDVAVLREVSVSLRAGEVVSLLGPNGSGKSTLIRCLLGLLPPRCGTIECDGRPMGDWTRRQLARRVAYLPQTPTVEPQHTVADVLRLGRAAYWSAFGVESARDETVVGDTASSLALTDLLHRRMDELSGGQRQRVHVGRCLVQEPAAMLLDEPATFLDLRHQVELYELLRRLSRDRGIGVLVASHDLNLASGYSDRLMLLNEGRIVAAGSPDDVLRAELLTQVYGVPMERLDRPGKSPLITAM